MLKAIIKVTEEIKAIAIVNNSEVIEIIEVLDSEYQELKILEVIDEIS